MISQNFRGIGLDADQQANAGPGKLALVLNTSDGPPLLRIACREVSAHPAEEHTLLAYLLSGIASSGYAFPSGLIVDYYVSLKTNPFVLLAGAEGRSQTTFVRLFAEALLGPDSSQYALIPGGASWPSGTGEDSYYRSLQERFTSWRFLDLLQEAAAPSNAGKVYVVCFDALHPNELEFYFATLLRVTPTGEKRLNLPGFPPDRQPIIPPNVHITATVNSAEYPNGVSRAVLRHAGLIEFRRSPHVRSVVESRRLPLRPAPVGLQRLWLRAAIHDVEVARARLITILGTEQFSRLRCSPELAQLLWRGGIVLTTQTLHELTTYIANSFDAYGCGLFDPGDTYHNARIAYDAQIIQRVLWRLRDSDDTELRQDLANYLDQIALTATHQAVA